MLNCYQLCLPKISNRLQIDLLKYARSLEPEAGWPPNKFWDFSGEEHLYHQFHEQTKTGKSVYLQYLLPDDLKNRIQEEMTDALFPFSQVNWYLQLISGGQRLMPHRDPGRNLSILYNLVPDTATTHFYTTTNTHPTRHIYAMNEVKEIENIQMKPYTWYSMNNKTIHAVSKMTTLRVAISSNISYFHPELELPDHDTFCRRYPDLLVTSGLAGRT